MSSHRKTIIIACLLVATLPTTGVGIGTATAAPTSSGNVTLPIGVLNQAQATEDSVSVHTEIREGQYITGVDWDKQNETAIVTVYSDYDAHVALADLNDVSRGGGGSNIDITNVHLDGGEKTTVRVEASVRGGDQTLFINSFDGRDNDNLALDSLSNAKESLFSDDPVWSYVHYAIATGIIMVAVIALLTYAYIWWTQRNLFENGFEFIQEET